MLERYRHQGITLDIYPPSTAIVWGRAALGDIDNRKGSTFVRRVRFRSFGHSTLEEALDKADKDFNDVANRVGARVVDHSWGFYRVRNNSNRYFLGGHDKKSQERHPPLLPDQLILVAEVELLRGLRKTSAQQRNIIREACSDFKATVKPGESYWSEAIPSQFSTYQPIHSASTWPLILHDIEPIMDVKAHI